MTKTELLSKYTAEQLADMVVEREKKISDSNRNFYDVSVQLKEVMDANLFNINRFERQVDEFQDREEKLQSEVEKYRKAFEDAKKERDCQIAEYQKKIEELYYSLKTLEGNLKVSNVVIEETIKNENGEESNTVKFDSIKQFAEYVKCFYTVNLDYIQKVLQGNKENQNNSENIADFLPTEPIKVADMLIDNAMKSYESYVKDFAKAYSGKLVIGNPCEDVRRQTLSYLRQIAEHLLVYCNRYGEAEE